MEEHFEKLQAALADHYDVKHLLGMGGMAAVYLAHDIKHDRDVAVKVLLPDLAASIGAERFLREITTTAKLSHPHILPLYDSGEAAGFLYYVMPYIIGETLGDRIAREKQLPIDESVRIIREVADALGHAHSYGLVHRDIKPDNIMLAGGHAILADFGIARALTATSDQKGLTQVGAAIGTPAYMSPEQASAGEVDARSDLYSLGCVLYEMLVGQIPFTGPTPQAIMARHTMDHVPPPSIMRDTISGDLEEIILACMAKSPADRFQTADAMASALNQLVAGTGTFNRPSVAARHSQMVSMPTAQLDAVGAPPEPAKRNKMWLIGGVAGLLAVAASIVVVVANSGSVSTSEGLFDPHRIAVMYFDDNSPDNQLQYLADGLTEGVIDRLARVRGLDVISRNGVAPFRDAGAGAIDSVARELSAGMVVRGSVEPIGERLRVSAVLVDGNSGADLERVGFDLPAEDLLAVQDSVITQVSMLLRARLGEEVALRDSRVGTSNSVAWSLYQRGERARKNAEAAHDVGDAELMFAGFEEADSLFGEAADEDESWASPVTSRAYLSYRIARVSGDFETVVNALDSVEARVARALERDNSEAWALEIRGTARYFKWLIGVVPGQEESDSLLEAAQNDLENAVDLDPTLAGAYSTLSHLYYNTDDVVEALFAAQRAYEQDAYLAVADQILWRLFLGNFDSERFPAARQWCQEGYERFPDNYRFTECHLWEMTIPRSIAMPDSAWALYEQVDSLLPEEIRPLQSRRTQMIVGGILAKADLPDSARAVLERARVGADVDPNLELPYIEAFMRTLLGDHDEAVRLLRPYAADTDPTEEITTTYWWFRALRDHPRFDDIRAVVR